MTRNLIVLATFGLAACTPTRTGPSLSKTEAIRIANVKAESEGYDLRRYQWGPISYEARDNAWWVNYRRKTEKYTEFSVHIEDKSKESWLVLP